MRSNGGRDLVAEAVTSAAGEGRRGGPPTPLALGRWSGETGRSSAPTVNS
jgi:hypothetical protein